MIATFLLLSSIAWSQDISSGTKRDISFANQIGQQTAAIQINGIYNGRPQITGIPQFKNGICFSNRTTDCMTSASGASISLTSTQTFSGANTFASSTTIGNPFNTLQSTANVNAALLGGESEVAFSSITAQTQICFYGLNSTFTWHIEANLTEDLGATGNIGLIFNGVTTASYGYAGHWANSTTASSMSGSGGLLGYINDTTNGLQAANALYTNIKIISYRSNQNAIVAQFHTSNTVNTVTNTTGSAFLSTSSPLSSVCIATSLGTLTGWARLSVIASKHPIN